MQRGGFVGGMVDARVVGVTASGFRDASCLLVVIFFYNCKPFILTYLLFFFLNILFI